MTYTITVSKHECNKIRHIFSTQEYDYAQAITAILHIAEHFPEREHYKISVLKWSRVATEISVEDAVAEWLAKNKEEDTKLQHHCTLLNAFLREDAK